MTDTTTTDAATTAKPPAANAANKWPKRRMAREPKSASATPDEDKQPESQPQDTATTPPEPLPPRLESKIASVIAMLRQAEGTTLEEMVEKTGWLPHTTRAALTGLRKKGHTIAKDKVDGVTRYTIAATAQS